MTAGGVTVTVRSPDGMTRTISCDYLAGCDGGTSAVRQALGIRLRGEANMLGLRQALYRCDELFDKIPIHGAAATITWPKRTRASC